MYLFEAAGRKPEEGMWGTLILALLNSPTVTHEPGLSTAYKNSPAIFACE